MSDYVNGWMDDMDGDAAPQYYEQFGGPVTDWIDNVLPPPDPVIVNVLDVGGKCMITASSKARKSFFTMQLAMSIASGIKFLKWEVVQRPTLFLNLEINKIHAQRRVQRMKNAIGLNSAAVSDMHLLNLRGKDFNVKDPRFVDYVQKYQFGAVFFDPLYKVLRDGDENSAQDIKPYLAVFDAIAESTGAAVFYVHHCAKGTPGERAAIDRGAGSGILQRDFDAGILLNEHAEEGLLACTTIQRNYAPQEDFSLRFEDDRFLIDDTPAKVRTGGSQRRDDGPDITSALSFMQMYAKEHHVPLKKTDAIGKLNEIGISRRRAKEMIQQLIIMEKLQEHRTYGKGFWVGIPGVMVGIKEKIENGDIS